MTLERITEKNIRFAIRIQAELFPLESARANFEESLDEQSGYAYYLLYEEGICIGVIGLYRCPGDPESAWLGWFAVLKEYRRNGFGSAALQKFEEMALFEGCRFARLYTDAENNDTAIAFYKANSYICEPYRNIQDPACLQYPTVIFSKSLTREKLVPWNSRNIHLTEQIAKQKKYDSGLL